MIVAQQTAAADTHECPRCDLVTYIETADGEKQWLDCSCPACGECGELLDDRDRCPEGCRQR